MPGDLLGLLMIRPPLLRVRLLFKDDCEAAPIDFYEVDRLRLFERLPKIALDFMADVLRTAILLYGVYR